MRCFVGSRELLRNTYLIMVNDFQEDGDAFCDLFDFSTLLLHTKLFLFFCLTSKNYYFSKCFCPIVVTHAIKFSSQSGYNRWRNKLLRPPTQSMIPLIGMRPYGTPLLHEKNKKLLQKKENF